MIERDPDPAGRWRLNGVWYGTEDAYLEARRRQAERRARLLAVVAGDAR